MTDRPIILKAHEVSAVLAGRKTQLRRVLKNRGRQPEFRGPRGCTDDPECWGWEDEFGEHVGVVPSSDGGYPNYWSGPYQVGDRLWVREAHRLTDCPCTEACRGPGHVWYEADQSGYRNVYLNRLRPSIHMPRWASRLTLLVSDVRVQRLNDISEEDALAEGAAQSPGGMWSCADGQAGTSPIAAFAVLWNSIHGKDAWARNPFVVALTFSAIPANIDAAEAA